MAIKLDSCGSNEKDYLIDGFQNGFDIGFRGQTNNSFDVKNLKSAEENSTVIDKAIEKEVKLGRIKGPFSNPPFKTHFQINPIGVVPKKEENSFRMITHLSSPDGLSINDGIGDEFSNVHYTSVEEAIKTIIKYGKGAYLAKVDIKSAFRLIPINPAQYHMLCFRWKDLFYHDCCLPMGARSSCKIFEVFSTNLEKILKEAGIQAILHYIDDFLVINFSKEAGMKDIETFNRIAKLLNVPLADDKTVLPTQVLEFLGLEIDTLKEIVRLPQQKIDKCKYLINEMMKKTKCQLKELQVLLGLLNFACSVIAPGRAFLQSLYSLTVGLKKKNHFKRLTLQAKADLNVFLRFLEKYNGISFYRNQMFLSPNTKHIYSDAAKSLGYGAYLDTAWFSKAWPSNKWKEENITFLELVPIVVSLSIWGESLTNCVVICHTDNDALHFVINKQYSKEPIVKDWIRKLVSLSLKHNILIKAQHIPAENNYLADHLSRLEVLSFLEKYELKYNHPANTYPSVTTDIEVLHSEQITF